MAGASQTITLRELIVEQRAIAAVLANPRALEKPMKVVKVLAVTAVKERFDGGVDPDGRPWVPIQGLRPRGGNKPLRDRGLLMASITATVQANTLEQGTNLEYASTHQYGATIRPKTARALAIPLTRQAYNAGGPRQFPSELVLLWPKGETHGFLVEFKGKGKRRRQINHYLLVRSVTIPARPFLGWGEKFLKNVETVFLDFMEGLAGGNRPPS